MRQIHSIKNVLALIQLIIIVPFILIVIHISIKQVNSIFNEKIKSILVETESIAKSENKIDEIKAILKTLAITSDVKSLNKQAIQQIFKETIKNTGIFYNLLLADKTGKIIVSGVEVKKPISASERLYFKRALREKRFVWGEFAISRSTGKNTIHFAMPVLNEKDEVISVIVAVPVMEKVLPMFVAEHRYNLIDENGRIVVSNKKDNIRKLTEHFDIIKDSKKESDIFLHDKHYTVFAKIIIENKVFGYIADEIEFSKIGILIKSGFILEQIIIVFVTFLSLYFTRKTAKRYLLQPVDDIKKRFENFAVSGELAKIDAKYHGELEVFKETYNKFIEIYEKTQDEIEKEKDFWFDTFNSFSDPIFIVDKDYRITKANSVFFEVFGIEKDKISGLHCYDLVHKTKQPPDYCPHKDVLNKNVSFSYELFIEEINKWYLITYSPLIHKGVVNSTIHILKDITKIKQNEEEKLKIEKQLLHTQRLESLGILAGGIAHDFNNMLTGILGNAELALMENDKLPQTVKKNLETIKIITDKAAQLTRQMLAYSGKGKFVLKQIDLNKFIKEIYDLVKVSISKKAVISFNLNEKEPLFIQGDPGQIEQVILNLVINASEALEDKDGLITITTGKQWCDKKYFETTVEKELTNLPDGWYAYFEVTDTGSGMDKSTMDKIFEPFFTTKFTGRGLGLSAILGIVRGHGGAIRVYSEKGKGSSFKIIFPLGKTAESGEEKVVKRTDLSNKTVLIVDDEAMIRDVAKGIIEVLGGKAITAKDGVEGIDIFKENRDKIDFVLLDLTMPKLSGEEVFRELKKIKNDIKVILMSGYNEHEVSQRLVGRGFAGFIQKPFSIEKLIEILQ